MRKHALVLHNNLQHNVPAVLQEATGSLRALARIYFVTEVAGQAPGTIDAKRRDLSRFLAFYARLYNHDRPDEWYASVTREFIREMSKAKLSQATQVRTYASVRHFARWIHRKILAFPLGCPADGIKPPQDPEPEWKGLSRADELRLLAAAQTLRLRPGRGTDQGLRDHAILATLLGCGLRVSELCNLDHNQYTGRGFRKVLSKGGRVRESVPVHRHGREVLDQWIAARGDQLGPMFTTRTGERIDRVQVFKVLRRIAAQANAHRPAEERLHVSPHVLRHTFLRKLAEEKGVHYAKEASGHRSDRYIWRYVKPDAQTLAEAVDDLG
jgi:integrase/recombinase XerD